LNAPEHVDYENGKSKQTNQFWYPPPPPSTNFFQNVSRIGIKLAKIDLKNVKIAEKSLKIGQFLPVFATFYEF
jgi:hypothetical protein